MESTTNHGLNVHSWLVVAIFMTVIVLVIHPVRIPLPIPSSRHPSHSFEQATTPTVPDTPAQEAADAASTITATGPRNNSDTISERKSKKKTKYPYYLTLDIATAPVLGVLFLLAIQSIGIDSVRDGIIGNPVNEVEPYAVMILFFSLVRYPSWQSTFLLFLCYDNSVIPRGAKTSSPAS